MYDNNGNANEQIENAPEYYFLSLENFSKNEEELATDTEKWLFLLQKSKFFSEIPEIVNLFVICFTTEGS